MSVSLQDGLKIHNDGAKDWVACVKCGHLLSEADADWEGGCKVKQLPLEAGGPLVPQVIGDFLLEQYYCPSCARVLETKIIEAPSS